MIRVLTVCGEKHAPLIKRCSGSIPSRVVHNVIYDHLNKGKHIKFNKLVESVKDDDICFLIDADDWYKPNAFYASRINLMKTYDFVYGDYIDTNDVVYKSRDFDKKLLKKINYIPYSTVMVKGWLLRVGFDDTPHTGDWITWHKILQLTDKFHYEPGIVCVRDVSTSYFDDHRPIIGKIKRLIRNYRAKQKIKKIWNSTHS